MTQSKNTSATDRGDDAAPWTVSVYYATSLVNCSLRHAWKALLDYQAWNPTFAGGSTVVPVRGNHRSEGEVVLIKKTLVTASGEPLPEFYAETVKVVPNSHIVWYVYPTQGKSFCNFCDFGLVETPNGVRFDIYYYAQKQIAAEMLAADRQMEQASLDASAVAFKRFCEANA